MINILLEVSPIRADGTVVTLRLSSAHANSSVGTQLDGYQWLPLITRQPARTVEWADEGVLSETTVSYEPVVINLAPEFQNEIWSTYQWHGAQARIWRGNMGGDFSTYTQIYEGATGALERNGPEATIPLLSIDHAVDRNLLSRTYAGTSATGGPEGQSSLRGVLKPFAVGSCLNVEPILVDAVNRIFQFHGYGATQAVDAVYENARSLGEPHATATTWAALAALELPAGKWAAAPAIGAFRLASQNSGKITADVRGALDGTTYVNTIGAIAVLLVKLTGQASSRVAASLSSRNEEWCIYATQQTVVGDELRRMATAAGCASIPTATGTYALSDWHSLSANPLPLNADGSTMPLVLRYAQLPVAPPVWQVKVLGDRCWSTHSAEEISQSVAIISADLEAKAQEIEDARQSALEANAKAVLQSSRLDDIESDAVLDRAEKVAENRRYDTESAIRIELVNRTSSFDVTAERTSYQNAWTTLNQHLISLSPSFFDVTKVTPITASYADLWEAYDVAKVTLLRAMSGYAATVAEWVGVKGTGKPADNADVTAQNTAKDTAAVGGVAASTIAGAATNYNAQNDRDRTPVLSPSFEGQGVSTTYNTDGSANLTIEWKWDGNPADIDGFIVTYRRAKPLTGR